MKSLVYQSQMALEHRDLYLSLHPKGNPNLAWIVLYFTKVPQLGRTAGGIQAKSNSSSNILWGPT